MLIRAVALTDQGLTHLQNHALSLLRDGFHRHEMHARTPGGLADRFGVVAIVLAAFDRLWCNLQASPSFNALTG